MLNGCHFGSFSQSRVYCEVYSVLISLVRFAMKHDAANKVSLLTSVVPAALSRKHPGVGEADGALGQAAIGRAVLLSDLPVSLATDATGLSLHPVHNLYLSVKTEQDISYKTISDTGILGIGSDFCGG